MQSPKVLSYARVLKSREKKRQKNFYNIWFQVFYVQNLVEMFKFEEVKNARFFFVKFSYFR